MSENQGYISDNGSVQSSTSDSSGQGEAGAPRFQVNKVADTYAPENMDMTINNNNNQMTYIDRGKTISDFTVEKRPGVENYQQTKGGGEHGDRPNISYLIENHSRPIKTSKEDEDAEDGPKLRGKVVKFGWLEGVLMRCLLNIWGVMLFLRLTWVIGQAGLVEGILVISLANLVTFITAFSMSAVATNGLIQGGGIYYMISRSLGPEFGAAIGLMFTIANSMAVAVHTVGLCESLNDLMAANDWGQIIDGDVNSIRVVGVGVVIFILILAFVGMDWVTRAQMFLLVILIAAQVDFLVGAVIGPVSDEEKAKGFIGFDADTFKDNVGSDYRQGLKGDTTEQTFFTVFGVFFPSVTGIVAGANLSGDLKDPAGAIPKGTLLAITITYISYIIYAFVLAGTALRETTGNVTQYLQGLEYGDSVPSNFSSYTDCINNDCEFGLLNDTQVMELISSWGPLIYMGCFAATLSSAIASLVGAPRVLQALAKDKIYPLLHFFAKGYGANNDPVRGYVLVFIISVGCLLIADLNVLAPFLSNFFLSAYCLINFSVFHATITKSPGWRPSFKYYNAWVSLFGSMLCVGVMFLMSWVVALVTVGVVIFLYLFVSYRNPEVNWGSSTQAQSYRSALSSLQTLNRIEDHVKNYRPQLLVLSGMPSSRPCLLDFSYLIVKQNSLFISGHVVKGPYSNRVRNQLWKQSLTWLRKHNKKGFHAVVEDQDYERGAKTLMQTAGLGRLKPNVVFMGYKNNWLTCDRTELVQYFKIIQEVLSMEFGVGILRLEGGLDFTSLVQEEGQLTPDQIWAMEIKHKKSPLTLQESQLAQSDDDILSENESRPSSPQSVYTAEILTDKAEKGTPKQKAPKKKFALRKKPVGFLEGLTSPDGSLLSPDVLSRVTQFHTKQKKGTIDVWWLYDDGGLTILLPYILSTRAQFSDCTLRIFSLASKDDEFSKAQISMATLLKKFRIEVSQVTTISDITTKAQSETKKEFEAMIAPFKNDDVEDGTAIHSSDLVRNAERTNRHLRLRELLLQHSKDSTLIAMTLPIPRKGTVSAPLYLAWLETITKGMPPFLLVRGNQTSVLTFYS